MADLLIVAFTLIRTPLSSHPFLPLAIPQDHVDMIHRGAFKRQRQYVNEMLTGKTPLPVFAKAACKPLAVDEL
jgi:hypothetical protein